jgi:hypothetical protein
MADEPQVLSFEEFKLYYESAEKVTDRRLEANRWNYSTCAAILVGLAAIVKWAVMSPELRWFGIGSVLLLCAIAILFCEFWLKQIGDLKLLNEAKFEVLNRMAPLIDFDPSRPGQVRSYRPLEREWKRLTEEGAVRKVPTLNIVAFRSTKQERFIPRAFQLVFVAVVVGLIFLVVTTRPVSVGPVVNGVQNQEAH